MIVESKGNKFVILHGGKEIDKDFDCEEDAWKWADANIDDQVTDSPNELSPPLVYRGILLHHENFQFDP